MENIQQLQAFKDVIDLLMDGPVLALSDVSPIDADGVEIQHLIGKVGQVNPEDGSSSLRVYGTTLTTHLDEQAHTITFDGFMDNQNRLFQPTAGYVKTRLTFAIQESGTKQLSISLMDIPSYRFSDSFPALKSHFPEDLLNEIALDDVRLTAESTGLTANSDLQVEFTGALQPEGPYHSLAWLFLAGIPVLKGKFTLVDMGSDYVPVITKGDLVNMNFMSVFQDLKEPSWEYLPGLTFQIYTRIYSAFDADRQQFVSFAELVSEFSKPGSGIYIPIVMQLHGSGTGIVTFYLDTDRNLPDLSGSGAEGSDKLDSYDIFLDGGFPKDEFAKTDISFGALSLDNLKFNLNPESRSLSDIQLGIGLGGEAGWTIIDDRFALESLQAELDIGDPAQADADADMDVGLRAIFRVGDEGNGVDLYVQVRMKDLEFSIGMLEGSTIDMSSFLDSFADRDAVLEQGHQNSLSITSLGLGGNISSNAYTLGATASGSLEIIPGIYFDGFSFSADYANGATDLDFKAFFDLTLNQEEVKLFVEASKDSAGAWLLQGGTMAGDPVRIDDLVQGLGDKLGITTTIPEPIRGLELDSLQFSYHTQSKEVFFQGITAFTTEGNQMVLQLSLTNAPQQDGSRSTSFSGTLSVGKTDPVVFEISFDAQENTLMLGSFSDSAGHTTFDVGDMINAILPTNDHISTGLNISMKSAFMAYLKESNSSSFTFAVDVGDGFDLSNLPLVGKFYPKGKNITLNYQLQYASAILSSSQASLINGKLPAAVHPLLTESNGTVKKGLDLAVSMNLGEDIFPFDLDLAASGSDDDPVNGGASNLPSNTPPVVSRNTGSAETLKWFDIQKSFGPVHFNRIGGTLNGENLTFALDASFSLGGLEISLDGLEVTSSLTEFDPQFELRGIGIDYSNPAFGIGAAFLRETITDARGKTYDEYDGGALLHVEDLTISAIGSYAYVNGQPSLFIYAALDYPLGGPPFFFVTGLSLGFGYNRSLKIPSVDKVLEFPLVAEAMNGQTLGPNAGKAELSTELESIHNYVPVSIGQMFLAAGINFTTFKLIDSNILLAASFGNRFELDLLGVSTLVVPPETNGKESLAVIQMALKGAFVPDDGFVGLSGQLTSKSHIISKDCRLNGGFAFYSWYSGTQKDEFVATVGGYHPSFKKPSYYPSVPRLSFTWQLDAHTHMTGDAYFALCAHAVMAGGHFEAVFEKDSLKAWYKVGADFLLAWKPYHYEASVYVNIGASYTYHFFGTHHISADVGADVKLWGPEFGGHAKVDLGVCSVGVDFGKQNDTNADPIGWDEFNTNFLAGVDVCSVGISSGLLSKYADENDVEWWVVNPKELTLTTDGFIPARQVNWFDSSQKVPSSDFNSQIGIGPMGISSQQLDSTQTIKVQRFDNGNWIDDPANFKYTVLQKKAPAALWGEKVKPGLNDEQYIDHAYSGLAIQPKVTSIPGHSKAIPTSYVQYLTTPIPDAFSWGRRTAFSNAFHNDEAGARNSIRGITSTSATSGRNGILAALGISAPVDLDASLADDFVLPPQVNNDPKPV